MTTMNNTRVLKASEGTGDYVSLLSSTPAVEPVVQAVGAKPHDDLIVESAGYSMAEVERLCDEARNEGATAAASVLEPALNQIADGLRELNERGADQIADGLRELNERGAEGLALALHADSERVLVTALEVAQWILERELSDEHEVLALATRALEDSGASYATRIRVNPDVVDALAAIAPAGVEVAADRLLAIGEFATETEGPDVSFRYKTALGRARDALSGVGS